MFRFRHTPVLGVSRLKPGSTLRLISEMRRLLLSQAVTLYITPVIYLALDKYSGKGPVTEEVPQAKAVAAE